METILMVESCEPVLFLGTGNIADLFEVFVVRDRALIAVGTDSEVDRDRIRARIRRGERSSQILADESESVHPSEIIPVERIRRFEWCDESGVFLVEYESGPNGKLTDWPAFLHADDVRRLIAVIERLQGRSATVTDCVITWRWLIIWVALPVSLLCSILLGGQLGMPFGTAGHVLAGIGFFMLISIWLWWCNRQPTICHEARFHRSPRQP